MFLKSLCLVLAVYLIIPCYSQSKYEVKDSVSPKKNLILFGETHFVNQKYDEIRNYVKLVVDNRKGIEKITLFLELPSSFQYLLDKLSASDTSAFESYFNYLYSSKVESPSPYWVDFKKLLYDLISFSKSKGIVFKIKSVDIEKRYRRTTFTLLEFLKDKEIDGIIKQELDSLFRSKIYDKPEVRKLLKKSCEKIIQEYSLNGKSNQYLKTLIRGLEVNCFFCGERDAFMFRNFISDYSHNSEHLSIGIFGLKHVIRESQKEEFHDFNVHNNSDTTLPFKPFGMLLPKRIIERTDIVVITALRSLSYGFKMANKIPNLRVKEREYLENTVPKTSVLRFHTKEVKELQNFSKYVDYLIIYDVSFFK